MRAWTPASRAAHATAWPGLPALAATTPAARSSGVSVAILLTAPRTLNAPVRWRFSALSHTSRPASRDSVSEPYTGVTRAIDARRRRASSMSVSVGAVCVANSKDLVDDLADRGERVEFAALHLVEQPAQLGIVRDCILEVSLRARRRDGEDLGGEILAAPLLQAVPFLEERPVLEDLLPERLDVLAAQRLGEDDRRLPRPASIERQDRPHLVQHRLRSGVIALVDRDHVGDLHDPGLERLHRVARTRHQHEQDRVGDADHLHLALAGADCLEEEDVLARGVEDEHGLERRLGEAAEVASRPHRADEDAGIEEVVAEPDPVAEEGALRERT